ncbi:rifin PIR protein, putative [Plasmodium reichenowi]|uniref:Rifin PIR protein, putative n=1 Tax=Plasmodium reichenowi TaxID=5854 RepID=A0A2P9D1G6_PLARE|nr:rifin PIR protein, putative [Plasmodium reichenowi]
MKLLYSKILLFALALNILLTSYYVYSKNKPYITSHHTSRYTSRVLSEGDIQSSIYVKDAEMKSVKEIFDRQTSQRFEEYQERMKEKRQKHREERDKNIQKIIDTDKREKSLEQKIEKGCLRCGCALGGVAASVGVFGGLGIYGSEMAATAAAAKAAGIKAGLKVGLEKVTEIVTKALPRGTGATMPEINVADLMAVDKFTDGVTLHDIFKCIYDNIYGKLYEKHQPFFTTVKAMAEKSLTQFNSGYESAVTAVTEAVTKGEEVAIAAEHAKYTHLYSAIGYSVLTILIIVLVMVIIYLVLRYRRKKKMKKKAQYTKLLNE